MSKTLIAYFQGKLGVPGLPGYPGRQGPKVGEARELKTLVPGDAGQRTALI